MANPAQILHGYFIKWNTNNYARDARGVNPASSTSLHRLRRASAHIESLGGMIDDMEAAGEDVRIWRGAIDRWTAGLFVISGGWATPQGQSLKNSDIELLAAFGQLLSYRVPDLKPEAPAKVESVVGQIEEELDQESHNPHLEKYLRNIIGHIRWCMDNFSDVGEFELEKAWTQLQATLLLIDNEESSDGHPSRFRKFLNNWFNPFTVGALAGMAGNLGSNAMMAITAGDVGQLPQ